MAEFGFLQSLQILALDAVLSPDWEASYRHVCRWYSKEFSTPLHTVEDLPIIEVMTHYYEGCYEAMDEEKRRKLSVEICETAEGRMRREASEAQSIKKDVVDVAASLQRIKKSMEASVKAADSFGRQKNRQTAKTVTDLQSQQDADGLGNNLSNLLSQVPAAPKPRSPADLAAVGPAPYEFTLGKEIPDDLDAIGGQSSKNKKP